MLRNLACLIVNKYRNGLFPTIKYFLLLISDVMDHVLIMVCKKQFSNRGTITVTTALGVWDETNIDAIMKNFPL